MLAPIVRGRKGIYKKELQEAAREGVRPARVDGTVRDLADEIDLDKQKKHTIEIVVDRLVVKPDLKGALTDSVETALGRPRGLVVIDVDGKRDLLFSRHLACVDCGISIGDLAPRMFSFNSPYGACPECDGLGVRKSFDRDKILEDRDEDAPRRRLGVGRRELVPGPGVGRLPRLQGGSRRRRTESCPPAFKKVLWEGAGDARVHVQVGGQAQQLRVEADLGRDPPVARAEVPRDRVRDRAARSSRSSCRSTVPGVQGRAPEAGDARGQARGKDDRGAHRAVRRAAARLYAALEAQREGARRSRRRS